MCAWAVMEQPVTRTVWKLRGLLGWFREYHPYEAEVPDSLKPLHITPHTYTCTTAVSHLQLSQDKEPARKPGREGKWSQMKGSDSQFSKFPPFWIIDKKKGVINCRPAQVINVNIRKSCGKKAHKKIFSAQYQRRCGRLADTQTHTHVHTCTHCKCIHGGLSSKLFFSLPFADKESRGSNLSVQLLHTWSENVKVSTCAFYWVCIYLIPPLLTVSMTKLYWQ